MKLLLLLGVVLVLSACEQTTLESPSTPTVEQTEENNNESSPPVDDVTEEIIPVEVGIELLELPAIETLTSTIDTSLLPSMLQGIRFISTSRSSFSNETHNESDGRNFPVGTFTAFYLDGREIDIVIESARPIHVYELFYAHAYRVAKSIGQLPLEFQSEIRSVILSDQSSNSATLQLLSGDLRVTVQSLNVLRDQNMVYSRLLQQFDFSDVINQDSWSSLSKTNESMSRVDLYNELNATYWLILNQRIMKTMNVRLSQTLSQQADFMMEQVTIPSTDSIQSLAKRTLPLNDTMNIATPQLGTGLVTAADPSSLVDVTFIETANRYYARGVRWTGELSGPFLAHVFEATYQSGHTMNLNIHASIEFSEAQRWANTIAFQYGQVPDLLLSKMDDFILLPGDGHPSSGRVTTFYTDVYTKLGDTIVQGFIHDMAHASLDWPLENNNKDMYDIKDDQTIIPHQGVTTRSAWLNAASLDNYYVSTYGEDNPEREDIAESIIPYLMLRWRPERFDPYQLQFIEESIPNRIAYFDTFDWGFPNK